MVDPITGVGLANSIVTLAEIGYKISKRTIEFSRLLGELPPDLRECSNILDILIRTNGRLQVQLKPGDPVVDQAGIALYADLELLLDQCNQTATSLLTLFDKLQSSNSLSKAIHMTRKEGEISKIRNKLDQHILALLFVLEGHQQAFNEDLRDTTKCLRNDFCQFHQKLVEQISRGFGQVETAVSDSKEAVLLGVGSLISASDQAAQLSTLRLLAGQQDLSQNLNQMEQAFKSVLQIGEARTATRFQEQLIEHQAATRTLFQSVYKRQNDELRSQMELLYQEVTKTLGEFEAVQKNVDFQIPNNHLEVKASFEFEIRSHFIAFHISQGMRWVTSTVLFPTIRPSIWPEVALPFPSFNQRRRRCNGLDTAVRSAPVNFMLKQGTDQYHLIKIDLSEERYDQDISKALDQVYGDYRDESWNWSPLDGNHRLLGVSYVMYSSYSTTMKCFTTVEKVSPYRDTDENFAVGSSPDFIYPSYGHKSSRSPNTFNHNTINAASMKEGYALMIEEGPDNSMKAIKRMWMAAGFLVGAIRYYRTPFHREPDGLMLVRKALDYSLMTWPFYFRGSLKGTLLFALPATFGRVLLTLYGNGGKGVKMTTFNWVSFSMIPICSVGFSGFIWLMTRYDVTVDWKDVRSLFRRSRKDEES